MTDTIGTLQAKAERARDALETALAKQAEAEARSRVEAEARVAALEQAFLDRYDPRQLRSAVRLTFEGMVTAALDGVDLTTATLAHLDAVLIELESADRARNALANGATAGQEIRRAVSPHEAARTPEGWVLVGVERWADRYGRPIVTEDGDALTDYARGVTFEAIAEAARRRSEDRAEADADARAAAVSGTS